MLGGRPAAFCFCVRLASTGSGAQKAARAAAVGSDSVILTPGGIPAESPAVYPESRAVSRGRRSGHLAVRYDKLFGRGRRSQLTSFARDEGAQRGLGRGSGAVSKYRGKER